jgi:hypothetical protein
LYYPNKELVSLPCEICSSWAAYITQVAAKSCTGPS